MTKAEIESKKRSGDWITLGNKLGCDTNAAKMRFRRDNPEAIKAMEEIVTSREQIENQSA